MTDVSALMAKKNKSRIKYGYIWAVLAGLMWGVAYVAMSAVWAVEPLTTWNYGISGDINYIAQSFVISAGQSVAICLVMVFLWSVVTGKTKEIIKTAKKPKYDKWLIVATCLDGIMATVGSIMAVGFVGPAFAGVTAMLFLAIGVMVAKVFNKEVVSIKTWIGVLVLIVGGIVAMDPVTMINELSNPGSVAYLGYIGALIAIIGWGVAGNLSVRVLDLTDEDSSLPLKCIFDSLIWLAIILPMLGVCVGGTAFFSFWADALTSGSYLFWELMIGLSMGMNFLCTYKALPLIGFARTMAMNCLYVIVNLFMLWVFLGSVPVPILMVGVVVCFVGLYIMYRDSFALEGGNRQSEGGS